MFTIARWLTRCWWPCVILLLASSYKIVLLCYICIIDYSNRVWINYWSRNEKDTNKLNHKICIDYVDFYSQINYLKILKNKKKIIHFAVDRFFFSSNWQIEYITKLLSGTRGFEYFLVRLIVMHQATHGDTWYRQN